MADCTVGDVVQLAKIAEEQLSLQLSAMGCLIGETLRLEKIAPFGDPMVISVDNNFISLRREDAKKMQVEKSNNQ